MDTNSLSGCMTLRPTVHEYFLQMARLAATRGTCARRRVGCVLVDEQNRILATGYNGVASGLPHCIDHPCPGAGQPSGQGLHLCGAIHAEANALISCRNPEDIKTIYTTASPCINCTRLLLNTPCESIVFIEQYPHNESEILWTSQGRKWIQSLVN